jgi:hypothetical protein
VAATQIRYGRTSLGEPVSPCASSVPVIADREDDKNSCPFEWVAPTDGDQLNMRPTIPSIVSRALANSAASLTVASRERLLINQSDRLTVYAPR